VPLTLPPVRARIVLAIFASVALASAASQVIFTSLRGHPVPVAEAVAHSGFVWMLFGALSFIAFWTARRFPLEASRPLTSVPAHVGAFAIISATHTLLYLPFAHFVLWPDRPLDPIVTSMVANLRGDVFIYGAMVGGYYLYAFAASARQREAQPAEPQSPPSYLTRIALRDEGRVEFIEVADVERIEADGDYVWVHAKAGSKLLRQSIGSLEKQLDPAHFARVHRSAIVRLAGIGELQPLFHGEFVAIMRSGARVKVSRTYRSAVTEALGIKR
jgi:hypothetical protein